MPKKSSDKAVTEKSPAKKAAKKSEETETKVSKKSAKSTVAAEPKPKAAKKSTEEKPKAAKSASKPKKVKSVELSPEQIEDHVRIAAYYRWEQRGKIEGMHEDDWIEAEKQIRS
ncbi:MAG: DUF2934 domain-containing protein [Chlorobiaceae bacterium]|nr:DUF2934 domain-containing protein [Chlorobiaceae bacterium]